MIHIALPFPISVNNAYSNNQRGRHKSAAYKAWEKEAGTAIKDRHRQRVGPYTLAIHLKKPDKRRRDLGNFEKVISDLLVSHGVVADDSLCERLTMSWDNGQSDACIVQIMPI